MTFFISIRLAYLNFFNFSERSSRAEYWWFQLFSILALIFLIIIQSIVFGDIFDDIHNDTYDSNFYLFPDSFAILNFIPQISIAARRLHDNNRSGWWQLIVLTGIGIIPLLYWLCKKGEISSNKYGKNANWNQEFMRIDQMFKNKLIDKKEQIRLKKEITGDD